MRKPEVSFCIPVKNRLADIQSTLARNLEDNRVDEELIEFIIVGFDADRELEDWIQCNFQRDLQTGYLRFYRRNDLENWHFAKAKNSFKSLIRGRVYASLDADNFAGPRAGRYIANVFRDFGYRCVLHQFQGDWGDGTCGRIALAREDYIDLGYDESFTPRQWDELDALLTVLANRRDRYYVHYEGRSILEKSHPFRRFFLEDGYWPKTKALAPNGDPLYGEAAKAAVGQHDSNYVQNDVRLRLQSSYNHLMSFVKNASNKAHRAEYINELISVQREMVQTIDAALLEAWTLKRTTAWPPEARAESMVLVSCVKNEPNLLEWYEHYKRLGVTQFLIVDDHSDVPVERSLPFAEVVVWRPIAGSFRHAKVFWLEVLLSLYCEGLWCLTVDSDEYLSLPDMRSSNGRGSEQQTALDAVTRWADNHSVTYFPGVLLDMFPEETEEAVSTRDWSTYVNYQFRPSRLSRHYMNHNTARWSYGRFSEWAHKIDIRYRLNQTVDSLRKFPLFRYERGVHLNQGFHDLSIDGVKREPDELGRMDLLPLLHYKLYHMVTSEAGTCGRPTGAYHGETQQNLEKLREGIHRKIRIAARSPFRFRYVGYEAFPVPNLRRIRVVPEDGNIELDIVSRLNRQVVIWRAAKGRPAFRDGAVEAETLSDAVEWLESVTPFTRAGMSESAPRGIHADGEGVWLVHPQSLEGQA